MDLSQFAQIFPQKMEEITKYVEGDDIKDMFGIEAVNHFKQSFLDEGFTGILDPHIFKRLVQIPYRLKMWQIAIRVSIKQLNNPDDQIIAWLSKQDVL